VPRDAEAWLAERGIERHRVHEGHDSAVAPIGQREARDLAKQARRDEAFLGRDNSVHEPSDGKLVDEALAFIRRSVASSPQAISRVASKLRTRGFDAQVIDQALTRAKDARIVDDDAIARAFVGERREQGHALARIAKDLRRRGFVAATIDAALAPYVHEDQEAAAFDLADRKAAQLSGLEAETAFRRVHGHVVRRGYPDGLARKVARQAVFSRRESMWITEH
jgi:regulatory protein